MTILCQKNRFLFLRLLPIRLILAVRVGLASSDFSSHLIRFWEQVTHQGYLLYLGRNPVYSTAYHSQTILCNFFSMMKEMLSVDFKEIHHESHFLCRTLSVELQSNSRRTPSSECPGHQPMPCSSHTCDTTSNSASDCHCPMTESSLFSLKC